MSKSIDITWTVTENPSYKIVTIQDKKKKNREKLGTGTGRFWSGKQAGFQFYID